MTNGKIQAPRAGAFFNMMGTMSMKINKSTSVFALFFLSLACNASNSQSIRNHSPPGITSNFFSCVDKANSDNIEIAACMTSERKYQDARLNKSYKALLNVLDGKTKMRLVEAERAWLDSKTKDETLENLLYGDEQIDNLQQGENDIFRICERANTLEKYLDLAGKN
ncbi:lysozyme inhibitor LprI family protein [Xanthomonas theicola]|nr:lysozyme inhibitor LprI family protein [Xanthomonas theicola]QNH26425.1 DUF1311 domain-containing protein [Xanthomonas theicola]